MKFGLDLAEVRDSAGHAVNLGDHQDIAFPSEVERGLELRPFRVNARKLLAENLPDASRLQIAKLSLKPGCLLKRRCPCVSDFHFSSPFVSMKL